MPVLKANMLIACMLPFSDRASAAGPSLRSTTQSRRSIQSTRYGCGAGASISTVLRTCITGWREQNRRSRWHRPVPGQVAELLPFLVGPKKKGEVGRVKGEEMARPTVGRKGLVEWLLQGTAERGVNEDTRTAQEVCRALGLTLEELGVLVGPDVVPAVRWKTGPTNRPTPAPDDVLFVHAPSTSTKLEGWVRDIRDRKWRNEDQLQGAARHDQVLFWVKVAVWVAVAGVLVALCFR